MDNRPRAALVSLRFALGYHLSGFQPLSQTRPRLALRGERQPLSRHLRTRLFALPFPKISKPACDKIVFPIRSAHNARARARELLDRAKRAVEIAIEKDERAALKSLEK